MMQTWFSLSLPSLPSHSPQAHLSRRPAGTPEPAAAYYQSADFKRRAWHPSSARSFCLLCLCQHQSCLMFFFFFFSPEPVLPLRQLLHFFLSSLDFSAFFWFCVCSLYPLASNVPTLSQSICRDPSFGCLLIINKIWVYRKQVVKACLKKEKLWKDFINTIFLMMKVITIRQYILTAYWCFMRLAFEEKKLLLGQLRNIFIFLQFSCCEPNPVYHADIGS